jgi:hypothetical protein
MPRNGEYLWTARPFRRFRASHPFAPYWWERALYPVWRAESRFWTWWYEASGQHEAFEHGVNVGEQRARDEIRRGIDAVIAGAKR